jgi:hypothetical protein
VILNEIQDARFVALAQVNGVRNSLCQIINDPRCSPAERLAAIAHLKQMRQADAENQKYKRKVRPDRKWKQSPKKKRPRARKKDVKAILDKLENL